MNPQLVSDIVGKLRHSTVSGVFCLSVRDKGEVVFAVKAPAFPTLMAGSIIVKSIHYL